MAAGLQFTRPGRRDWSRTRSTSTPVRLTRTRGCGIADGSQSNGVQNRFADGNAHFTYRFPFPADTTSAHVTLTIDAEYLVQASSDNEHWTTVLQEDPAHHRRLEQGRPASST